VSLSSIPRPLRKAVAERDGGKCGYCGLRQTGQAATFHVNHIIPRSGGGTTSLDNLVLQCPWCSLHKADKVEAVDPDTEAQLALFDPLRQRWLDHFLLHKDGTCVGLTPVGRATVIALAMNDPLPKTARALQVMLGLA
jgi:5-methylcytosine-specific restriction endonuclease McrA